MQTPTTNRFRYDWLIVTLVVGALALLIGYRSGLKQDSSESQTPLNEASRSLFDSNKANWMDLVEPTPDRHDESIPVNGDPLAAQSPDDFPRPTAETAGDDLSLQAIFDLQTLDHDQFLESASKLTKQWKPGYLPMLIELTRFSRGEHYQWMSTVIDAITGQSFDGDLDTAWQWAWMQDHPMHPDYGLFKAAVYRQLDPRFVTYFDDHTDNATIRLDEIRWGGVHRDGIPPLDRPKMVAADSPGAEYLADDNVVFGIKINGDARAYPKRILAWHEMFKDRFGPEDNPTSINGVYCTLCGSMIVYDTVDHKGTHHELGTSGFLYRSNKLMYDHATESMWNTLTGKPVVGPLVGQGIELKPYYVVTTTWGQWKRKHPDTTVLSLDTGHRRDYGEGVAYRDYFADDQLMFTVPKVDTRLKNKAEVLALRFGRKKDAPAAIDTAFLAQHPIYAGQYADQDYVVLTDPSGANRIYDAGGVR